MPEFTIDEMGLSRRLNVGRGNCREIRERELQRGVHWEMDGHAVKLTLAAAQRMASIIGVELPPEYEKNAASPGVESGEESLKDMAQDGEKTPPAVVTPSASETPAAGQSDNGAQSLNVLPQLLQEEVMRVAHCTYRNQRVVLARRTNQLEVIIQVRDASRFVVGMEITAKWIGDCWICTRHPRQKGRY